MGALRSLRNDGLAVTARHARMYVAQRFLGVRPDLVQHRYLLGTRLAAELDDTVTYGPFKGMRLGQDYWWSGADRGSMLLGLYEQEVLDEVVKASAGRPTFVDVGAADGYYTVGAVVSGLFESAICFESSSVGRELIGKSAELNRVADRIRVYGEAGHDFLQSIGDLRMEQCVFLLDIEGGEFDLLTPAVIAELSGAILIVEVHPSGPGSSRELQDLVDRTRPVFDVRVVGQGSRDPGSFPELADWCDDDRWLLCSESRARHMSWIVLEPRN